MENYNLYLYSKIYVTGKYLCDAIIPFCGRLTFHVKSE